MREGREGPGSKPGLEGRDRGRGGGGGGGPGRAEWGARWRPGARASVMSLERREAGGRPSAHNARRPGARGGRGGALGRCVRAARRRGGPGTLSGPEGRGGGVQVALEVGTLPDVAGVSGW